jgi:hypothetical protein
MQIFKKINDKDKKIKDKPSKKTKSKKIKKKTKIGLNLKNKQEIKQPNKEQEDNYEEIPETDEIVAEITPTEKENKKDTKKKKTILSKDSKGKPVFLEDTGEKLGTIFDTILDKDKKIIGYKIKDIKSDSVLSFTLDNFEETKNGFLFIPGWYTNSLKIIEKLEFKDKISPDLTTLLSDDTITNEELYDIFVKHDDEMVNYIDDAKSLREMLTNRLKVLEKQRVALKEDLMDLTEKRLIKDIDRKQFSEDVSNHRRKVNILDININKCKSLLKRLEKTSFGLIGKNNLLFEEKSEHKIENNFVEKIVRPERNVEKTDTFKQENNDIFKDKYYSLKQKYDKLEDDYKELKIAVDELFSQEDI